ncbi:hypothetical protein BC834DRAFT_290264 [Gloeopeniophorella convolvens]|nr:hypothetical protein BC834DRAFT_290264 [Gloeopeniophorella convolvens]
MSQNKEAIAFISRVANLPRGPVSLDAALQPSLDDEAELRKLFATDKGNARLKDIHVGLVDVFAAPGDVRVTRERIFKDEAERDAQHVMVLPDSMRRREGSPAIVEDFEAFKKNWGVFTENSLSMLTDWNNVVAAGGSVQACLMPLPKSATASKKAMRKFYHDTTFPSSDIDLFLYGMTPAEAERKIISIYEAVRDSVPWDVTCVRTKHTVSIHSQYPYRCVQIVLRLYSSPAEILAGFDVDAPCCAFDGDHVWANPRAIVAMMRQSNTVDMTRRSPSYEVRLAKYSARGFEVYIPGLKRADVDPTIYERSLSRVQGLARLLAIEKLATPEARERYQQRRSLLRGRPTQPYGRAYARHGRVYRGDLKANAAFSGLETSDYDIVNLHIPYGPGWDARRIEKLIYKTDFGANSPYNPKNKKRRLHRHSAFFGTMEECIEDCCEGCPDPKNEEEHNLQDEEDKSYVRGRIAFIEEDPGRQSISGSFNPIDEGEWADEAYIRAAAKFFNASGMNDTLVLKQMIEDGEDVDRRDHVGRTPLHVAILSESVESANILIDAGARMTARLVGGRTSFHLAAQMGQSSLIKKMLERSAYNDEKAKEDKCKAEEAAKSGEETEHVRMSSEDDWSSEEDDDDDDDDDGDKKPTPKTTAGTTTDDVKKDAELLEDNEEEPDVIDIAIKDWDFGFTALGYAILSGTIDVVDTLLSAGADPNSPTRTKDTNPLHPLTLTIYTQDEDRAVAIAERLVAAQALSSAADERMFTIFHRIVASGKTKILATLLKRDPNAKKVLDIPAWSMQDLVYPVVTAINAGDYATLSVLLAHGVKLAYSAQDISRAEEKRPKNFYLPQIPDHNARAHQPIETALANRDQVVTLLAALGAPVDLHTKTSYNRQNQRVSMLQWTIEAIKQLEPSALATVKQPEAKKDIPTSPTGDSWLEFRTFLSAVLPHRAEDSERGTPARLQLLPAPSAVSQEESNEENYRIVKEFYETVESALRTHGAKLSEPPAPLAPGAAVGGRLSMMSNRRQMASSGIGMGLQSQPMFVGFGAAHQDPASSGLWPQSTPATLQVSGYVRYVKHSTNPVPIHLKTLYDELYEACWIGDNARIQELCLPKHIEEGQEPIQIIVQTSSTTTVPSAWTGAGWTPFSVAVHRRHWETARLVLAIAAAQYQSPEEATPFNAAASAILHDDSDEERDDMDVDSDYGEQAEEINFTDVAARPSAVRTDVPPSKLLEIQYQAVKANGKRASYNPIQKAMFDNDFEAFVRILDMQESIGVSVWPEPSPFQYAMSADQPEMVDELIRRSGVGIPIVVDSTQVSKPNPAKKVAEERVYLGLKVGGKRRADLAPPKPKPAKHTIYNYDILRAAINSGATKVVEYLAGSRPLAAYKYYASTHSDNIAQYVKSVDNSLEEILPGLLGWEINDLNESPLLSAVIHNKLDILKQMFVLKPKLMGEAVHKRVKYVGLNALLVAAYYAVDNAIVDLLLEKGCDPSERDPRGWNIYHLACLSASNGRTRLVKHLLKVLPKELSHELLGEASKGASNTPLMLATKRGFTLTIRSILEFGISPAIF